MANRLVVGAGGAVLVLAAVLYVGDWGSARRGPPSSSYTTGPAGLAAYAELLARYGHPVEHLRGDLTGIDLDPATTLVVLDAPELAKEDARRLRDFLAGGGRLVAGGEGAGWLAEVVDEPPRHSRRSLRQATPLARVPEVAGIRTVRAAGPGTWSHPGAAEPALGLPDRALAVVLSTPGDGRLVALADASPLQNRLLGEADNAAFGLGVAGEPGRPVRFAEGPHGYGRARGLGALPWRWRLALAGLAGATALWLWARARRLGPPESEARPLPPPRRAFVDAMAATLARTRRPGDATAPVRARAREMVARRAGLGPDASAADLRRAAAGLGLAGDEIEALMAEGGTGSEEQVVAAGRALARLSATGRST
jgi:hypothetical protein